MPRLIASPGRQYTAPFAAMLILIGTSGCAGQKIINVYDSEWARHAGICQSVNEAMSTSPKCKQPSADIDDHRIPSAMDKFRGTGIALISHQHLECSSVSISCTSAQVAVQTLQLDDECRIIIPLEQALPEDGAVCRIPVTLEPPARKRKNATFYYFALSFSQEYVSIRPADFFPVFPVVLRE
ncbi:MAG: hypothetical protein H6711_04185 [Myxococcales bacterium]|nr:hypothetical protein [Myxococcales bacterium]